MTLPPYSYTGVSSKVEFTLSPFTVDPPACAVTYSCEVVAGPRLDICTVNDGSTQATSDPSSGDYSFESTDMANYPPGTYEIKVTGTVGTQSDSITFVMELVDPCPTA